MEDVSGLLPQHGQLELSLKMMKGCFHCGQSRVWIGCIVHVPLVCVVCGQKAPIFASLSISDNRESLLVCYYILFCTVHLLCYTIMLLYFTCIIL